MAKYCGESSSSSMVMGAGVWGVVGCMVADGWMVDWIGSSCDAKGEKMRINEQSSQNRKTHKEINEWHTFQVSQSVSTPLETISTPPSTKQTQALSNAQNHTVQDVVCSNTVLEQKGWFNGKSSFIHCSSVQS